MRDEGVQGFLMTVRDAMIAREDCVTMDTTIADLARRLDNSGGGRPVIGEHECLGTVGAPVVVSALASGRDPASATVGDLMRRRARPSRRTIAADASLEEAHAAMVLGGTDQLMVVEDGRVLGVVGRAAVDVHRYEPPDHFPLPPDDLIELVLGAAVPRNKRRYFFESGARMADVIRTVLRAYDRPAEGSAAVLDFGCGCGRVVRHLGGMHGTRLHGSDYNPRLIAWCRDNLPFANFAVNGLEPPLDYEDQSFDLVYVLSVFTHLPAELQIPWVEELGRVMRPGGTLFVTLHGESTTGGFSREEKRAFSEGQLVVRHSSVPGTNECAAYHPSGYVEKTLAANLDLLAHLPDAAHEMGQDVVLMGKPA